MEDSLAQGFPEILFIENRAYHYSDGSVLPVVSGGSDNGLSDDGGSGDSGSTGSQTQNQGSDTTDYSLASPFLEKVPAEHRPILEPYVKQWDAGVTRRLQDLHGQYRPFKDIGADPEILGQAYQLYQLLESDPKKLYDMLHEEYGAEDTGQQAQNQGDPSQSVPGIPQEWQQRFEQQQQILEALVEHVVQDRQTKAESTEDTELEEYLGLLKQEAGEDSDYFENFILAELLANDGDGEAALQSWQQFKQGLLNQSARPTPPVLSGGGSAPTGSQSVRDLTKKDRVGLVSNLLSQVKQE